MRVVRNGLWIILFFWVLAACTETRVTPSSQPPATGVVASPTAAPIQATPESTPVAAVSTSTTPVLPLPTELPPATQVLTETPADAALPTLSCGDGLSPTRPDMEGPYFLAGSPEKASLIEPGMSGTPLTISGYVVTVDCQPVMDAKIEFWQADANGEYDLQGYRLRGHVFTDSQGRYQIQTILPAPYETRPRHIHVMVLPPGQPGLTSQLYFPGDSPYPELTVNLSEDAQGAVAIFDFVLEMN